MQEKLNNWIDSSDEEVKKIDTDEGTMTISSKWDYDFVDQESIPNCYMMPDHKKIREAIDSGIRSIPGIDIFETEEISFRVKNV